MNGVRADDQLPGGVDAKVVAFDMSLITRVPVAKINIRASRRGSRRICDYADDLSVLNLRYRGQRKHRANQT